MVKLSPRLQIIYDMVPECDTIADVGCDHGLLSIALIQGHKAKKAIAMDVNKGPLEAAKANVTSFGLNSSIDFRLSDGVSKLNHSEADVICICGMGGALIAKIISSGIDIIRSAKTIIVEPQSECGELRRFLIRNHLFFVDEELCIEEGKIYPIMKLQYMPDKFYPYTPTEVEYGPINIQKKAKLLKTLADKNEKEYVAIYKTLSNIANEDYDEFSPINIRKNEILDKLNLIRLLRLKLED